MIFDVLVKKFIFLKNKISNHGKLSDNKTDENLPQENKMVQTLHFLNYFMSRIKQCINFPSFFIFLLFIMGLDWMTYRGH